MRSTDRTRLLAPLVVAALLLAASEPVRADEAVVTWRPAALWGADVRSLAIHPQQPDTLLAGTSSGQVYLSTDGGEQWRAAGDFLPFPGWVVSALAFDPNRPGRVWAGLRGMWGDGLVSVTDDLGRTWLPRVGDLPDLPIYSLALVPGEEGVRLLGMDRQAAHVGAPERRRPPGDHGVLGHGRPAAAHQQQSH